MFKALIAIGLMYVAAQGGLVVFALAFVALPFVLPCLFEPDDD